MKPAKEKKRHTGLFVLLCLIGLMLGLTVFAKQYRQGFVFEKISSAIKKGAGPARHIGVDLIVIAGIDNKSLRLTLNIPCKNMKQKEYIIQRLPRIKNAMLISMDQPIVKEWVQHRNFRAIKNHALMLVNNYSNIRVKNLYMESFFYN